ncbi:ATP-binding protein [Brasilonema bromeliae]|uniref:ATP-binding protein n=1 Tax=Brasilonema bromeliae SPC951 TaxID=385972 RepID=A0ABX1PHS3_9CYAN|nr:ATP-binding protein [Brasilonema bromeliae]NMG23030.1 ATP-binding protein [Brasilonema bromeliae SPC951]
MNITPRPSTASQKEFQQLIHQKSSNFVGREFAFAAITDFLNHQLCGYFTIVGTPGSGKSAILAKYVMENPSVVYYSAEVEGKNCAEEFLITVCTQLTLRLRSGLKPSGVEALIREMGDTNVSLPDNATEGSWFLSLLLQKVSDLLEPDQRLIIAIDGCDQIDLNNQSPDSNLFYLPRYLPERVYFLLTRRPFKSEKSGLLIETPAQILDLEAYSKQNREDVQTYIQQYISVTPSFLKNARWINNHSISEQEFCQQLTQQLTVKSENNFMYLNHILKGISQGFYRDSPSVALAIPFQFEPLPPGLEAYYKNHYQRIKGKGLSPVGNRVLKCLAQLVQPLSVELIAQIIDEDEYEVEKVLENWLEFLHQEIRGEETFYSFYHTSFANWLGKELNLVSYSS